MNILDKFETLGERENKLYKLPPEVEALRDKIIERFKDEPLSEIADFVQRVLKTEKNDTNRLAALAARVYLIRNYVNAISGTSVGDSRTNDKAAAEAMNESFQPLEVDLDAHLTPAPGLRRVKIIVDSTVNGVFFPAGVTVDVKKSDAERLTEAEKVSYVSLETGEIMPADEDPELQYGIIGAEMDDDIDDDIDIDGAEDDGAEDDGAEDDGAKEDNAEEDDAEEDDAEEDDADIDDGMDLDDAEEGDAGEDETSETDNDESETKE